MLDQLKLIETIIKVYETIVIKIQEYNDEIERICNFITYLDVIYTKAIIADKFNYCKPQIKQTQDNKSFAKITGLRHCLIEKIQQSELYVANDICIGDGNMDGLLLYGTNAVGKTSFIRALGISIVMAQAGLYVPASTFIFRPYKYIFTRILGNDNLFKGLSTFAVEMSELRTILRLADKNSLVLGDELCSGTESISAISIFVSGIQMLSKVGCSFIFATHLHEIINYDEITELNSVKLKHMSVIYDREKDCLIYDRKLKDGPGTNMYGLEVCKSLNLPQEFLDNANNIRMKYNPISASILDQKKSKYNAKCIKGICNKCGEQMATEVHHLAYQEEADSKGTIINQEEGLTFHKNNLANLINICEKCHNEIHKTGKKYKKVKTTKGTTLKEI
jgi:DNA mismatch repair protein MutS